MRISEQNKIINYYNASFVLYTCMRMIYVEVSCLAKYIYERVRAQMHACGRIIKFQLSDEKRRRSGDNRRQAETKSDQSGDEAETRGFVLEHMLKTMLKKL